MADSKLSSRKYLSSKVIKINYTQLAYNLLEFPKKPILLSKHKCSHDNMIL